jgi:hypothetical protein
MDDLAHLATILRAGPGVAGAIRVASGQAGEVRARARALLDRSWDEGTHVLVGVSAAAARGTRAEGASPVSLAPRWPQAGDLFVQVAAVDDASRNRALGVVDDILRGLALHEATSLHRLPGNREAFGFKDGTDVSDAQARAALVASGTAAGASVVLYLRFAQDVAAFQKLSMAERERVMGIDVDDHPIASPPPSAHVHRFHDAALPLVRRSLPVEGAQALAFVACAPSSAVLENALRLLDGDAVMRFARPLAGGSFVALPSSSMLDGVAPSPVSPASEVRMYDQGPSIISYPVVVEMLEYIMKARSLGAFEGPIGEMKLNPHLEPVLRALHIVLAGGTVEVKEVQRGNPEIVNQLNALLAQAGTKANEINQKSGYYVTLIA